MRLIDADVLIERLQEYADNDWNKSLGGIFVDCIDICIDYVENAPTAYDVEKVVAELEEAKKKNYEAYKNAEDTTEIMGYSNVVNAYGDAIATVRNGGKE